MISIGLGGSRIPILLGVVVSVGLITFVMSNPDFLMSAFHSASELSTTIHVAFQQLPPASVALNGAFEPPEPLHLKRKTVSADFDEEYGANATGPDFAMLTLVTAASDNHFDQLMAFTLDLARQDPHTRLIVYDLGLRACQRQLYDARLLDVTKLLDGGVFLRSFNYSHYPRHFNISANAGEYAWKPAILKEVVDEFGHAVWLDSGDRLLRPLLRSRRYLARHGCVGVPSDGVIQQFTHPQTRARLRMSDNSLLKAPNCNGAWTGFTRNSTAYHRVLLPWLQCAMDLACIAPEGSNRWNNRRNQAALSILINIHGLHELCCENGNLDGVVIWGWEFVRVPHYECEKEEKINVTV